MVKSPGTHRGHNKNFTTAFAGQAAGIKDVVNLIGVRYPFGTASLPQLRGKAEHPESASAEEMTRTIFTVK